MGITDKIKSVLWRVKSMYWRIKKIDVPTVREIGREVSDSVGDAVEDSTGFLKEGLDSLKSLLAMLIRMLEEMRDNFSESLKDFGNELKASFEVMKVQFLEKFEEVKAFVLNAVSGLGGALGGFWDSIKNYVYMALAVVMAIVGVIIFN